jgi:hypothetical protein
MAIGFEESRPQVGTSSYEKANSAFSSTRRNILNILGFIRLGRITIQAKRTDRPFDVTQGHEPVE